jgi:hypothetical protein
VANGEVTILTYNPFDLSARQAVGQELRKRVHWQIAPRHRILEALHQGYGVGAENFEELLEGREAGDDNDDMKQETTVLDEADEEATVMNFVNQVFREGSRSAPRTFTWSRWSAICASATAWMASCSKSRCRRTCACCRLR